jgi:hypothetical protein
LSSRTRILVRSGARVDRDKEWYAGAKDIVIIAE